MSEISKRKVPPTGGSSASQMTFEGTALGLGAARPCSLLRTSQTYHSFACDAMHRASPDAERLSHLQNTHTLREQPSHAGGAPAMWPAIGSYPTALCANAG
jgi:hypothetical protein